MQQFLESFSIANSTAAWSIHRAAFTSRLLPQLSAFFVFFSIVQKMYKQTV
jgi:hypothetical protein